MHQYGVLYIQRLRDINPHERKVNTMKYLVTWEDMNGNIDIALVGLFHATQLLKGQGLDEITATLYLSHAVPGYPLRVEADNYTLLIEKVKG